MRPGQTRVGCASHEWEFDLDPRALILTRLPSRPAVGRMVENGYVPATGLALSWLVLALQSMTWTWLTPTPPGHPERSAYDLR